MLLTLTPSPPSPFTPSSVAGGLGGSFQAMEPTRRWVAGECRESLAFDVALGEGVAHDVLARAYQASMGGPARSTHTHFSWPPHPLPSRQA
jgi:hypothetical protein